MERLTAHAPRLALLLLCGLAQAASAQDEGCKRLVDVFGPSAFARGDHQATFGAPVAPGARFFLTVEEEPEQGGGHGGHGRGRGREDDENDWDWREDGERGRDDDHDRGRRDDRGRGGRGDARVVLNGEVVLRERDLEPEGAARREVTLLPTNQLRVTVEGRRKLTVRLQGVVPETALPAGEGRRVAEVTLFQEAFPGKTPPRRQRRTVTVPSAEGVFVLGIAQGTPPALAATLRWNGEAVLGAVPLRPGHAAAQAVVGARQGQNTLDVWVLGRAGTSAVVTLTGFVVDEAAPTAAWASPAPGSQVGPETELRATYADSGSGVDPSSVRVQLDGARDVTGAFAVSPSEAASSVGAVDSFLATSTRTPPDEAPLLVLAAEPRAIDGSNNDPANPLEGKAGARLQRQKLGAAYGDGVAAMAGPDRPGPRQVSNAVHSQAGALENARGASDYLWVWGQFLDHDLSLTRSHGPAESRPVAIPRNDPFFDPQGSGSALIPFSRSRYDPQSSPREQLNELSAWIDASMVYGSDPARAAALRTNDGTGRLKTGPGGLLPPNTGALDNAPTPYDPSFPLAGDIRASETITLLAMHTLFVREHNRLAGLLKVRFPAATDEELYQAARRVVSAEVQAITYQEFLPTLLGSGGLGAYSGYDPALSVGIENAFANAAFRLGHTLLSPRLLRLDAQGQPIPEGSLSLKDSFFVPERLTEGGGIEPLLRGAARQRAQELDPLVVDGVRNFLFGQPGQGGLDLASLNVQRGRDHGLPTYNEARRQLGLAPRASFAQVSSDPKVAARLAAVYQTVEQVDLWTGALCEDHLPSAMVGQLLHALLSHQFRLLREGDRFFYERDFSGPALDALRRTRLADVIRRNTQVRAEVQDEVFLVPARLLAAGSTHALEVTVRDRACNEARATVSFSVAGGDTTPPVIGTPGDLVVEQTSPAGASVTYQVTVTDDQDPAPTVECTPPSGSSFPAGVTVVSCVARDRSGNTSQALFLVEVKDRLGPSLTQPEDLTVEQTSPAGAVVTYAEPTATDLVDPAPVVSCTPASGTLFPPGPSSVVCTAIDSSGNQSQVSFAVLVRDSLAPSLTLAPPSGSAVPGPLVEVALQYADPASGVDLGSVRLVLDGQDVSGQLALGMSQASATFLLQPGQHTAVARVRDFAGNEATASSTFSVGASAAPVAFEVTVGPGPMGPVTPDRILIATEHALNVRAITSDGATATAFAGLVRVTTSDGKLPLDGLVFEITPAHQGQVILPDLAFFQTLGLVVITAQSVPLDPGDLELAGSLTVTVVIEAPKIYPQLPPALGPGQELVVSGYSFPGQLVELVVDGQVVASAIAGADGSYTLSAVLAPGQHQVQTRAADPGGVVASSGVSTVDVAAPATAALEVEPAQAQLAVGQTLQAKATERFVNGSSRDAGALVSWQSTAPAVATVDAAGLVRAVSVGAATIRATLVTASGTFTDELALTVGVPILVESSPFPNEATVAVTRETILRFSAPLDVATVTSQAVHASFGGQDLAGRLHVGPDGTVVTLFYAEHLPASSRVRVAVDGDRLRDTIGNKIDANKDGVPGGVALIDFDTLSLTAGPPGTVVCGRVFASELGPGGDGSLNVPLEGVKISVEGAEDTFFTFTDALGDFRMEPAPAGKFFVLVDGRTASNGVPPDAYYPAVGKQWESKAGEEVNVGTSYLPLVRPGTLQAVSQTQDTTLTFTDTTLFDFPNLRGTQIVVPADSLYADDGTRGGAVGIAPVPPDRLPGQLPGFLPFPLVITVQTDGATNFDRPIAVRFPNLTGLPAGSTAALWSFNHDTGAWEVVGGMHVTADGMFVETDPGVGILAPGWHSWLPGVFGTGGDPFDPFFDLFKKLFPELFGDQEQTLGDGDCQGTCKWPCDGSVLLHSGEERMERVDLVIPGRGMDFAMRRTYRNQVDYDGVLGFGWSFDYDERLRIEPNGDVTRMNGRIHLDRWVRQAGGTFAAPRGFFGALRQRVDGVYVLREPNGLQRLYSPQGFLFCYVDRFGNQLGFERDEQGDVDFVIDTYGRQIDFTYATINGQKRLTKIRDYTGREVLYAYSQQGDLVEVRGPVVLGTSNGNDFPAGRTERYGYSSGSANPQLNHNLLTITAPEEVATGGPPRITIVYGTDENDPMTFDKVVSRTEGGTNASGVPAGGTTTFEYAALNQGVPPGDKTIPRGRARITDPNGNVHEYFINEDNLHVLDRTYTRGLRPGEPAFYETRTFFNEDNLVTRRVFPEGNEVRYAYQSGPRAGQRNVIEKRLVAGPRGADGAGAPAEDLVTTYTYEPLYNQLASVTDARGNSPTYAPPLGANTAGRYTRRLFYDYQEHTALVPQAVELGIDLSSVTRGLGDLNGDGRTDQSFGQPVRSEAPAVLLEAGSGEAARLGSTTQAIVTELVWNDRGQLLRSVDPEGNVTSLDYFMERDPDGNGAASVSPWRVLSTAATGYLRSVTVDAGPSPRRTAAAPPTQLARTFAYDEAGNLVASTNPRGVTTRLEVNALNEVVVTTRGADVSQAAFTGQLITGEHALAYRTRYFRDHDGRVTRIEAENKDGTTEGVGSFVDRSTVYDILDRPVELRTELDATTTLVTHLRYDPNQNPVEVTAPEGNRVVTVYDERDLPFTLTRGAGTPEASTVQLDYDRNGNRVRITDAEDTDGDGQRESTSYRFDGFDRQVEVRDALGDHALTSYDLVSNVVRSRTLGHPPAAPGAPAVLLADAQLSHDELNRVFRTDASLFLSAGFAPVRPVSLLDQDGDGKVTTKLEWDALSRPTFVVEDDLEVTRTIYDGASRAILSVDALGNRFERVFDNNNNVVLARSVEVSPEGLVPPEAFATRYVFDQLDRLVRATDNAGQTSRFGYDSRDNLVFRSDPEGPLTADPLGQFPGQINAPGNTCRWVYDGLDRMIRQVCDLRVGGTGAGSVDTSNPRNPDGQISLSYVFDGNSRLTGIVDDAGNRTSFGWDTLDRKISQTNADGSAWAFAYDRDHNVRSVTDPNGSVATKTYDVLNRLIQIDVARAAGVVGTTRETFAYDGLSRLVLAQDDNGGGTATQTWEGVFDSLGRLLEERQNGRAVSSQFTGDGKRHQVTYPGGRAISRTFDAIDRIKQLKDGPQILAACDWIGAGMRELQRQNGNGTRLTFLDDAGSADLGYDAVQRITRLRVLRPGGGAPVVDREYAYNRASQRTLERRHDDFGLTDTYTYDSAYRVVASSFDQAGLPGATPRDLSAISYVFDGVGNRRQTSKTTAAGITAESFTVNAVNEYTSITTDASPAVMRSHDLNGNLTDDGVRFLSYDYKNRLVGVLRKADLRLIAVYGYLPDGRRNRKQAFNPDTGGLIQDVRFLCDGPQEVEEQDPSTGTTLATYVWSPGYVDELVEFNRAPAHPLGAGSFFAHQDARCSVVAITNATGTVVERRRYDDYGREEVQNGAGATVATSVMGLDYGFQGRRHDRETGLVFFRARYYDPDTGRFLQRDPVWDAGSVGGQYTFVGNGPISRRDAAGTTGENVRVPGPTPRPASAPVNLPPDRVVEDFVRREAEAVQREAQRNLAKEEAKRATQAIQKIIQEDAKQVAKRNAANLLRGVGRVAGPVALGVELGLVAKGFIDVEADQIRADARTVDLEMRREQLLRERAQRQAAERARYLNDPDLSAKAKHDMYVDEVVGGAEQKYYKTPYGGGRYFDHYDPTTDTGYEGNTTPWSQLDENNLDHVQQIERKLIQAEKDAWLRDTGKVIKNVEWFGTEELPETGLGGRLRRRLCELRIPYEVR